MERQSKLSKLFGTTRDPEELQSWFLSLVPLGIAFLFFHIFLLNMDIPNRTQVTVVGTAAGIAGLQAYWVVRGWRKNHIITMLFGLSSIAMVLGLVWLYLAFSA